MALHATRLGGKDGLAVDHLFTVMAGAAGLAHVYIRHLQAGLAELFWKQGLIASVAVLAGIKLAVHGVGKVHGRHRARLFEDYFFGRLWRLDSQRGRVRLLVFGGGLSDRRPEPQGNSQQCHPSYFFHSVTSFGDARRRNFPCHATCGVYLMCSIAVHYMYYNFVRTNQAVEVAPAIEAGSAKDFRTIDDRAGFT